MFRPLSTNRLWGASGGGNAYLVLVHNFVPSDIQWCDEYGRVEGSYNAPPLSVRSGREAFTSSGSRFNSAFAFCPCVCNRGMTHVELPDYFVSSYGGFHLCGASLLAPRM